MTLTDVLVRAATEAPGQGIVLVGDPDRFVTFAELHADALRVAGGLHAAGLTAGDPLPVIADDSADFLALFWGAVYAGAVPVPLPPEPHRLAAVWRHLDRPPLAGDFATPGATLLSPRDLRGASPLPNPVPVRADDLAFLQFSSGSTGTPKGVELTHANVVANLAQATHAGAVTRDDVVVTWMPYFHDMGLIGTHLAPLYARCRQIRISPLAFAKRPETWLRATAEHRGTVLSAANFALALVNRRVPAQLLDDLDLSSVRLLMVGAEPISPAVWRAFTSRLARARLAPGAMQPVYGLAEATVAVTCPPLGVPAVPLRLSRAALSRGVALPVPPSDVSLTPPAPVVSSTPDSPGVSLTPSPAPLTRAASAVLDGGGQTVVELMDVGLPMPGCELRIVDDEGNPLEECFVGHIQVRGPNVTRGYHRDETASAAARDGAWLRTGDLGFLRGGRLVVTGRHKDVLFVNGRTFHAADLEEVAAATPGLTPGPIAVVGATDQADGREQVVVFLSAPSLRTDPTLSAQVRARVAEVLAYDGVRVEVVPNGAFARTTSGKLRRQALRDRITQSSAAPSGPVAHSGLASQATPAAPSEAFDPPTVTSTPAPTGPVAPWTRPEMETLVRAVWARVLRVPAETIGPDDRFLAIGGSSLAAMEVLAALEDALARPLDPATLRDCATVPALADHLLRGEAASAHPGSAHPGTGGPGIAGRGASASSSAGAAFELVAGEAAAASDGDLVAGEAAAASDGDPVAGEAPAASDGDPVAGEAAAASDGDPEAGEAAAAVSGPGRLAVIGMACRFPGAGTPEEFWANLVDGRDSVAPVERWPGGGYGAFLDDPAMFDAGYFGIDADEARLLDPHARIFLELAHEALERAGYAGPRRRGRRIGVFAAVGESGYPELMTGADGPHALTGTLRNLIAARVSHLLDLRGPALAVDTACSSALVALHLARLSLAAGDCDIAVVGGVNLNLTATGETLLGGARALSPTGRCRAFAADADGFVPGEGGAALVLTRLADAGDDRVLAVVCGTAVNNDGRSLSLMAPNPLLQQEVIADAYRDSGVDPADVTYVEAHGTGTPVGDPIEARSLAHAFPPRNDGRTRLVGSVKTNIGHLLNVAGLPALVKVILALQHREIPPSLHHDRPSPRFDLAAAGFEVPTTRRPWIGPLVAGVNGFGFGGTNAHVILTAAPHRNAAAPAPAAPTGGPHLLTLSARSAAGLRAAAADLAAHLRAHPALSLGDVCATVSSARDEGPYRIALVTGSDLAGRLASVEPGPPLGRPARVAFLFGGQGTQRPGQGANLYATAPVFRAVLDEVSAAAGPIAGRTLTAWCTDPDVPAAELARTEVTQPLVVAFAVAQAAQLAAYGIRPDAVTGHSVGEFAAAVSAGQLTAVEAVVLAAERGRLTAELAEPGAMLAVASPAADLEPLPPGVAVAAENAAHRIVLAGPHDAIDRLEAEFAARGVATRRPAVSHAFHSPAMEPVAARLAALAPNARPARIPLLSTVTGEWGAAFDAAYLAAHAVRPVRFAAAAARLRAAGYDTMVELGASVALSPLVRADAATHATAPARETSERGAAVFPAGSDAAGLLRTAGALWLRGAVLDRTHLDAGTRRADLPTYPFQRRRHWVTDPPPHRLSTPAWTVATPDPRDAARPADGSEVTVVVASGGAAEDAFRAITAVPGDGCLLLITRDLFATGAERPVPAHAVWAGLAMAFADENPRARVRIVDLCSDDPVAERRAAVEWEKGALPGAGPAEIVAWRGGRRLVRTFVAAPVETPTAAPPDGSFLIVGGGGAVGAEIARHLARRGRPRLLLAGRSAAPVALLGELRDLGAIVEYRVADLTVPAEVAALVAGREFDVVVQAAGVARPGSLRAKTPGEVASGVAAKVDGTRLLLEALGDRRPLVVALSSVSSVVPGLAGALGDYVAGNAYLDALAAAETAAGRRFVSVNLPPIAGGGLAARHGLAGAAGLPIEQVPGVLWAAVALGVAQVLVAAAEGAAPRRPRSVPGAGLRAGNGTDRSARREDDRPAAPGATPGWGRDELVAVVRELLAGPLGRAPETIGTDEPFLALGLDSLTAVDLVKELERRLGRTLSTTLFFENRTIDELTARLAGATEFPLSPVQRAFVTTGRLYPDVPAYAYVRQTLRAPVDVERLGAAFAELERRHPMLRVRFGPQGQRFVPPGPGNPAWFTVADPHEALERLDAELRNRPFDLTREAPIRAVLAVEGTGRAHLILVVHHAAADGYSIAVLGDELWALYRGGAVPAAPEATFADHEARRDAVVERDLDHWRAALAGCPRLALPFDGDPDDEPRGAYAVQQRVLEEALSRRLAARAREAGVSVFHLLLAGYVRCLARWSGQSVVPVSVARAGRAARLAGVERMVGPFADTLPVLAETRAGESAATLAARLRDDWLEAERHGSVSTVDLARMLAADGAGPRTASPASFSFARFPNAGATGADVVAMTAGTASAATRLGLVCFESGGALHFSWNYPEALFEAATVDRLATEHLAEIAALAGAAGDDAERGIVARIRAQCARTPDGIAVLSDGVPLSYAELDLASDRLAGRLAETGARRIGLLTGPGADTVIGLVGILKAGAAWVPLDGSHPPARLADQLARAGADVVVRGAGSARLDGFTLVDVGEAGSGTGRAVDPDDTAYVIFTSGSTGRPKGVPVTHRSMINYLDWSIAAFGYREGDRLAQTASICFDASVRQLLAPLLVGATVVAWDRDTVRDPELLVDRLARDRVTVWSSVPTLWERLLTAAEKSTAELPLRWVHVGGEELSPAHVRRWFDRFGPGQRITNLYGPTETTINATWHLITERPADDATHLPIGRPVGGAVVEVIGDDGRPCPDGVPGELHIGGAGLADGYLGDPEQTAAVFVERDGRRWYRSGDRVVRDADGLLWFRGRLDDQVKLHGYRVEPGEVEAVLRAHPAVDRVAVRVEGGRLVAWARSTAPAEELRSHLSGLLPAYLVPSRIHVMDDLPLTATGKIDRALLARTVTSPPVTGTERLLASLWERQLGVTAVGRDDDFFALGGDSIGVLELFASLAEHRATLPRPTVVYRSRTLAALAAVLDETVAEPAAVTPPPDGDFPVSLTQRGFLLADAVGAPSTWLAAPRLHGPLDRDRFQSAVDVLVERHPMLRTVFPRDARPPVQRELPSVRLTVGYEAAPRPLGEELAVERECRFDPAEWPLVRLRLLRYGPEDHVLLVHAHHLAGDGYSTALLMRELLAVYDGDALAPLRATFRDYVEHLNGVPLETVPDDGGPISAGGAIVTAGFTVDGARLRDRAAAAGTTPVVPVLAAYHRALALVTGRPDPLVGVAVTGRDHALPDLGRIFGPCATAVAVQPGPDAGPGRVAAAVDAARTRMFTAPQGWRYFFTYLDFGALGAMEGRSLRMSWDDDGDADLALPPGTDILLAVRPTRSGALRLTLRSRLSADETARVAAGLTDQLSRPSADLGRSTTASGARENGGETPGTGGRGARLDAALVGYLPAPEHLAALATALPDEIRRILPALDRETIRETLFPGRRARLLETADTPLGRSGFVALPRFADELTRPGLAEDAAAAADTAAAHGARTVSLAGMIPALTGYGGALGPYLRSGVRVTSGHAVTAASVVRTTVAAAAARGRKLRDCTVAILGAGSIGTSSLRLLLTEEHHRPARLILCDLPSAAARLAELAATLDVPTTIVLSPEGVYPADVVVAATSGGPTTLDVDRLRPGTIVVDDSFPHCFDTGRALARMRERGDVLIVGGGLLDCGEITQTVAEGLPAVAAQLPGAIASCRLESLLHAARPELPLVAGPVTAELAAAYGRALDGAGVRAAPLHLLDQRLDPDGDVISGSTPKATSRR